MVKQRKPSRDVNQIVYVVLSDNNDKAKRCNVKPMKYIEWLSLALEGKGLAENEHIENMFELEKDAQALADALYNIYN